MPGLLVCDDDEPWPSSCEAVGVDRLDPERFEAVTNPATRGPESDPVDDCELALRTITGFLLDTAVVATIFLPIVGAAFSPLAGKTDGGGGISVTDPADIEAGGPGVIAAGEVITEATACLCLADEGSGGGGISDAVAAALFDVASPSWIASSAVVGGDANRAVGRGPDAEGPLDFFRIGCGGGGLEDDGVGSFLLLEGV